MRVKLIIVFLLTFGAAKAQNWQEWTRQKKTQKKYLLQQIAALQVYAGYAHKGYAIANEGLAAIGKIKRGDLDLHNEFFTSLKNINPKIAASVKVAAIVAWQTTILKQVRQASRATSANAALSTDEKEHCKTVIKNLLVASLQVIADLTAIITSDSYGMSDDQRLKRIDKLFGDTQSQYAFFTAFATVTKMLSAQRADEHAELNYSKKMRSGL